MRVPSLLPIVLCLTAISILAADSSSQGLLLDQLMTKDEQARTGVSKLSQGERAALEQWLIKFAVTSANLGKTQPSAMVPKSSGYDGLGQKHWVKTRTEGGALIQLEDGSLWQIAPLDKIYTALWLPIQNVVVAQSDNPQFPFKLVSERDTVEAKLLLVAKGGDIELFDSKGAAVAYFAIDRDLSLHLWEGKPCAYLVDEDVFGFNGKHLGWFRSGVVYDHDGNVVAALASAFRTPVAATPAKGAKEAKPARGAKEARPARPAFSNDWSRTPATAFFLLGSD